MNTHIHLQLIPTLKRVWLLGLIVNPMVGRLQTYIKVCYFMSHSINGDYHSMQAYTVPVPWMSIDWVMMVAGILT